MTAKILIVDDDADVRAALSAVLRPSFAVLEAPDGEKALSLIAQENPVLVLLDVSMPGVSGIEVLKKARAQNPSLRILMLTSHHDIDLAAKALTLGATEYITKPFDAGYIRTEVEFQLRPLHQGTGDPPWRHAP